MYMSKWLSVVNDIEPKNDTNTKLSIMRSYEYM